jgi:small-conductance mechanosensitive channel
MQFLAENKKYRIGGFIILAAISLAAYFLTTLSLFSRWEEQRPIAQKLTMSLFLIAIIFIIGKVIERIVDTQTESEGIRYNLLRIVRLLTVAFVLLVVASFLFQNLYTVAVSFGIISLVLGFALQAPITSFIAWLYIVFRRPFQVGDRIQIEGIRGDVIAINYLDTIIEECSGVYLGNDRKSGRLMYFPNSVVLKSQVINYSGPFSPFIWNETAIQISYTSDLQFVEACLLDAAKKDFNERYPGTYESDNDADIYFRINTYAWLEAVVSYPVEPQDTTGRRNRILKYALPALNAEPDRVGFPEGTRR